MTAPTATDLLRKQREASEEFARQLEAEFKRIEDDARKRFAQQQAAAIMAEIYEFVLHDQDEVYRRIWEVLYNESSLPDRQQGMERHLLQLGWKQAVVPVEVLEGWQNVAIRDCKITINQE